MRKQRFFDLNGFDVIFQLPAWILFSMLLTIPGTCFALVIITRAAIAKYAAWVLLGLALLWLVTLAAAYLIVGALARAVAEGLRTRPRQDRPPMIVLPPGVNPTTETDAFHMQEPIPWVLEEPRD